MPKQDAGYKLLFSHQAMVRDFLRAYYPGDRSRVRTEDLEAVQKISGAWIDERELLRRDNDIAWLCKCSSEDDVAPFVLLVEFQLQKSVVSWLTRSFLPTRMPNITTEEFLSIQNIAMTIENNTIDWSIPYIEQGREQGREQGLKEGEAKAVQVMLQKLLARKFGSLSSELISQIESAEMDSLGKLVEEILDVESIEEVERFLNRSK